MGMRPCLGSSRGGGRLYWVNVQRSDKSDLDVVNAVLSATFEKQVRGPSVMVRRTLTDDVPSQ